MKKAFVIYDTTSNTGKHYIDSEGNNVEEIERAEIFHLEANAREQAVAMNDFAISEALVGWAVVHSVEVDENMRPV